MFTINLTNKWLYTFVFVLLLSVIFSVYAYTNAIPNPGHGGDAVLVEYDETEMSVQDALNQINFVLSEPPESVETDFTSLISYKRGGIHDKDQIVWCDNEYPLILHCSGVDDQAPNNIETTFTQCLTDGLCPMNSLRGSIGGDDLMLELVKDTNGRWGCLAYDDKHGHQDYRLDIVCMKESQTIDLG